MRFGHVVALGGIASLAGIAAGQNISTFDNGGFEEDISFGASEPGNWLAFFGGGAALTNDPGGSVPVMPRSGDRSLSIGNLEANNSFAGVQQGVAVNAGQELTFSLWAKTFDEIQDGLEIRIEFRDSDGNLTQDQFINNTALEGSLTEEYQQFSVTDIAPDGTATATVVIAVQSFDGNGVSGGLFSIDDATFVPTPAGAALLGLGGLAAARRRRR